MRAFRAYAESGWWTGVAPGARANVTPVRPPQRRVLLIALAVIVVLALLPVIAYMVTLAVL